MSLPSGYTRLEYIQSNGAQYINAGLQVSSKTRVVCTISNWPKTAKSTSIFGCRASTGANDRFVILCSESSKTYRTDFYNSNVDVTNAVSIEDAPVTIDKNRNVTTFSNMSASITNTSGTFSSTCDLYIFACNTGGTAGAFTNGVKLYSMQIYTDDTLMRDYIPCKNANGVVGLWDDVWSVFYPNSGSGNFTAGPAVRGSHQALVNGTAYNITGGRTLIGGTGYGISKGRTLIDGTGYDITFPVQGTPLSDFEESSIIKLNENGSPVEFVLAKHNYESGLNGAGRTLLVRLYGLAERIFSNTTALNAYAGSSLDSYLTGDYKNTLDSIIQQAIGETTIYYTPSGLSPNVTTLARSVFQLSLTELGGEVYGGNTEGSQLPVAAVIKVLYTAGVAARQWTRTPNINGLYDVYYLDVSGSVGETAVNAVQCCSRPAFTLPDTMLVDADRNVIA